jgi:predicted membrane protein
MNEKIKKDRQLLIMFFLLWVLAKIAVSHVAQQPVFLRVSAGIAELVFLILSTLYVYKMYKWYNSPKAPPLAMAIIYIIFDFIFPLISIFIGAGIIYESRKLLK